MQIALLNVIRRAKDESLLISGRLRQQHDLPYPIQTSSDFSHAQNLQQGLVDTEFAGAMNALRSTGTHVPQLWDLQTVTLLDQAYLRHVRPHMGIYGRINNPQWKAAMAEYRQHVLAAASERWTLIANTCASEDDVSEECLAYTHAPNKLAYLFKLRQLDVTLDVPLLSPTYVEDSLKSLEGFTETVRWVSAILSPSCLWLACG